MQQRPEDAQRSADSDAEGDDAHVFDAAVGEQTLQVALHHHQQRGDRYGQATEDEQQRVTECAADGVRGDRIEAQQRIQGAVQQHRGEHGADRGWRFGMRIGQPTVHGNKADLGAVTDGNKDERKFNQISGGGKAGAAFISTLQSSADAG